MTPCFRVFVGRVQTHFGKELDLLLMRGPVGFSTDGHGL